MAIFGITGATGRAVANLALSLEVPVRTIVRPGSGPVPGGADWIIGSLMDHEAVGRVIDGVSAVCCCFGPRPPYHDVFTAAATSVILSCMREVNVSRIVCLTGAMIGRHPRNRTLPFRLMERVVRWRLPESLADRDRQEEMVMDSGLDWTVVKPPRLTVGKGGRGYRVGAGVRVGITSSVSRVDVADFMVDSMANGRASRQAVFIKG